MRFSIIAALMVATLPAFGQSLFINEQGQPLTPVSEQPYEPTPEQAEDVPLPQTAREDLPDSVTMHRWPDERCDTCDEWLISVLPQLTRLGVKVNVKDDLPPDDAAPQIDVCYGEHCHTANRSLSVEEILALCPGDDLEQSKCSNPDCVCEDCDGETCACQSPLEAGPGYTPNTLSDSVRMLKLENRVGDLESRVDKVEKQLRAIVVLRNGDGTTVSREIAIDHVTGYGDFQVPKGGKVISINGVTLQRTSSVSHSVPVYTTTHYSAALAAPMTTSRRVVRITPRWTAFRGSCATCR